MRSAIDIDGKVFGFWTVVGKSTSRKPGTLWICRCICGKKAEIQSNTLRKGRSKSCGCKREFQTIHGHARGRDLTYSTWVAVKSRCLNPNNPGYPTYGGAGITIDDRWLVFENFLTDMGERPPNTTIDRIDNAKGYFPGNCRWADNEIQNRNKRTNIFVNIDDKTMIFTDAAREVGINVNTVYSAMRRLNLKHQEAIEHIIQYRSRKRAA